MTLTSGIKKVTARAALGVLALGLMAGVAEAQVYVHVGPPRPIVERRPPPRPGYEWRAGYQRWDGSRYVWVPGEYIAPPRRGVHWHNGYWRHTRRGHVWVEGYWR